VTGRRSLVGRAAETGALNALVSRLREGGGCLGLVGAAGVGKTALLDDLAARPHGCRVVRVPGVASEAGLGLAVVHRLCVSLAENLPDVPGPANDSVVRFLKSGRPDDALDTAVIALLRAATRDEPILLLVDDADHVDPHSAALLASVAERLAQMPVVLLFACRVASAPWDRVTVLDVGPLPDSDMLAILEHTLPAAVERRFTTRLVAESRGVPEQLLQVARLMNPAAMADGYRTVGAPLPEPGLSPAEIATIDSLPEPALLFLRLASAEPLGDPELLRDAADRLRIETPARTTLQTSGLVDVGDRVLFVRPLLRATVYRTTSAAERLRVHAALASVTDPAAEPDLFAWHLALSRDSPDEKTAALLEQAADRGVSRNDIPAAAALLERAVLLTAGVDRRAVRAVTVAEILFQLGEIEKAAGYLAVAEAGPLTGVHRMKAVLLNGHLLFAAGLRDAGLRRLVDAAAQTPRDDHGSARELYLDSLFGALYVGRRTGPNGLLDIARSARSVALDPPPMRAQDLLLAGAVGLIDNDHDAGVPAAREAIRAFRDGAVSDADQMRWGFLANLAAYSVWDDEGWRALSVRQVWIARRASSRFVLPFAIIQRIAVHLHAGELRPAEDLLDELTDLGGPFAAHILRYATATVAAHRGDDGALDAVRVHVDSCESVSHGTEPTLARHHAATLLNASGRYTDALSQASRAVENPSEMGFSGAPLAELVEAAVRCGRREQAVDAQARLRCSIRPSRTPWGLGVEARCAALLATDDEAEYLYRDAIGHLEASSARVELARAHLVYGEWLRRSGSRAAAERELTTAQEMFTAMGTQAFARRASAELVSVARAVRPESSELTAREGQVARLAADGLADNEIARRLFISPRTVQHHLGRAFDKLGVRSRGALRGVLDPPPHGS
jgi:DNA-binding CsgD family transcriptional regulator